MLPQWILFIAIYLHNARGNTFIEEPVSAEASESPDQDTKTDLYRVLLGNAECDDTPQFKVDENDTPKYLSHILRSQFKEHDTPQFIDNEDNTRRDLSHILRSKIKGNDTPKPLSNILRKKQSDREILDERKNRYRLQIARAKHMRRVTELLNFMQEHVLSTEYFYSEMNRIKRQRMIKDSLRNMVENLEEKPVMKKKVLKCYYDLMDLEPKHSQLQWEKPNTLVINDIMPNS